jgi:hypothetical protein
MAEEWEGVVLGLTATAKSAASELNTQAPLGAVGEDGVGEMDGEVWAQLRFAAHAALLLRGLGLLRDPKLVDEDELEVVAR